MKTLTLLIIAGSLAVAASANASNWIRIAEKPDMDAYLDASSINTKEGVTQTWEMVDYKKERETDGKKFSSTKNMREYQCAEARSRTRYIAAYQGNKGTGTMVGDGEKEQPFKPIIPDSLDSIVFKIACIELPKILNTLPANLRSSRNSSQSN